MKYSAKDRKFAKSILEASIKGGEINDTKFLSLISGINKLKTKRTLSILQALLKEVSDFYKKQTLLVESAEELHSRNLDKIRKLFQVKTRRHLDLEFRKDESLLAGMKITLGDTVWDYSVNQSLESLKEISYG